MYASQVFGQEGDTAAPVEKVLLVFSDARQCSQLLNLEVKGSINSDRALQTLETQGYVPDLQGVRVGFFGVHTRGRHITPQYYQSLKGFWQQYITRSKGTLATYQTGRNTDVLLSGGTP